jgi:PAS domain S-box
MVDVTERKLAEEQLTKTEELLRSVIGNTPVILFAFDRSGVVTLSEGKGLDTFGVKPGELVGRSIFDLYRDSPDLHANARRALAGESVTFVTRSEEAVLRNSSNPTPKQEGRGCQRDRSYLQHHRSETDRKRTPPRDRYHSGDVLVHVAGWRQ